MIGNFSLYRALKPLAIKLPPIKRLYSEKINLLSQINSLSHENQILANILSGENQILISHLTNLNNEKQSLAEQVDHLNRENQTLANQLIDLSNEKQTLNKQLTDLSNEKQTLNKQLTDLSNEKQLLAEQINHLNLENQMLANQLADLSNEKQTLDKQLTNLKNEAQVLVNQLISLNNANQTLTNQVHVLSNEKHIMQEEMARGKISIHNIAGTLNWPEILNTVERVNGFAELIRIISLYANHLVDKPSICWDLLATKNYDQLLTQGFTNFKRTINHNYFNFLVQENDVQIKSAEALLSPELVELCRAHANLTPNDPTFTIADQRSYYYFVLLLWEYAKSLDSHHYMDKLVEPEEGNPLVIYSEGKKISQDLANSLIEYYSISEVVSFKDTQSVLEIGGGYGRNAFVILALNSHIKMTLVDIPPALYVAQRYLSSVFKDHNVFMARHFSSYEDVKTEMEAASIVFLLPHQLGLIPNKHYDLGINISSFGEMRIDQLDWYFNELNRLTSHYFYTKQWQISKNPFDEIELNKSDYPYPNNWQPIYQRPCAIQTEFFEALYQVHD